MPLSAIRSSIVARWLSRICRLAAPRCGLGAGVVLAGGLVAGGLGGVQAAAAQVPGACVQAVRMAEFEYRDGAFGAAASRIAQCISRNRLAGPEAIEAYRLLTLAHLRQDKLEAARAAVIDLLGIVPAYRPDPVTDPPAYVTVVNAVRSDMQLAENSAGEAAARPTPFFRRTSTWLVIGGTVVVGGTVAAVLTGTLDGVIGR
jgi:hypothetical protein